LQYFVLVRIQKDQVADCATRKVWTLVAAEKSLAPNLGYEPEDRTIPSRNTTLRINGF
jgi:5-methyltetrahydrofolate--homocysteine methyltransferase